MGKYRTRNGPGQYTKLELDRLPASCERQGRDLLDDGADKSSSEMTVPEPPAVLSQSPSLPALRWAKHLLALS